jgi:threonine/homoserine/homoserine lactone efflux protein
MKEMKFVLVYFFGVLTVIAIFEWRTGILWNWAKGRLREWLRKLQKRLQ